MWKRRRPSCSKPGGRCEFDVVREMVHDSPDGRVFRVQRLVCAVCGERVMTAEREPAFAPLTLPQDAVQANF